MRPAGFGPLALLWEAPHGPAVNTPAGMLTQPSRAGDPEPTLDCLVRRHLRPEAPASVYLGTVHRLDRPVSGVVLWAKHPRAAHRWATQFAQRRTEKIYWAIAEDRGESGPAQAELWADHLLSPDRGGQARVVAEGITGAVLAVTRGDRRPEPAAARFARLILAPETGRTHQLRAQAAARVGPILGDRTYGSTEEFPAGIALHARSLVVEHPARRDALRIEAALPPSWDRWREGW